MKILSIETSCDETGVAILEFPSKKIIFEKLASQVDIHKATHGVVPEKASRIHAEILPYFLEEAQKKVKFSQIDYFAVTQSPGLIGSLLCGVNTAKILAQIFNKPLIPVNHILAHLFSPFVSYPLEKLKFPALGLVVSGGHTILILANKKNNKINLKIIGETRDDAAGEAFDKIARLIGLGYPGGPEIQKASEKVKKSRFIFTPPMIKSKSFDFSYSGLKTEVLRTVKKIKKISPLIQQELAFGAQKAIIAPLVEKAYKAVKEFKPKIFLLGGGVAANILLRKELFKKISNLIGKENIFFPSLKYAIDNAPMIALCAYILLQNKPYNWYSVKVMSENLI